MVLLTDVPSGPHTRIGSPLSPADSSTTWLEVVGVCVLSVHLQDGFDDDIVVVSVDDDVERRLEHVTTRLLLGYAEVLEIEVPGEGCRLGVALPRRGLRAETVVPAGVHVGVSIDATGLKLLVRDQPFGYA